MTGGEIGIYFMCGTILIISVACFIYIKIEERKKRMKNQ